jgi:hypothetical protein
VLALLGAIQPQQRMEIEMTPRPIDYAFAAAYGLALALLLAAFI